MSSIIENRKKLSYRLLEGSIGSISIGFLIGMVILSFFVRSFVSVFLILYSFLWVLKFCLNTIYTIYTYKQLDRWEELDWPSFLKSIKNNPKQAALVLNKFKKKYDSKLDWSHKIEQDEKELLLLEGTKFDNPLGVYHITIFSIYNEPVVSPR